MSDQVIHRALYDSVNEVLEKMFFVQTMGESSIPGPGSDAQLDEIAIRIAFQGEPSGALMLRLTSAAARQIAADFLGIDEAEVSDLQTSEVVGELANMICGSLLSRMESATTFHLEAPRMVAPSEEPGGNNLAVELPNGRLIVKVAIETPTCLEPAQSAS